VPELARDAWVLEGHDGELRGISWPRATHFVWLDPPLPTLVARVLRRAGCVPWRKLLGDLRRLAPARAGFRRLARPEWIRVRGAPDWDQLLGGLRRT